MGVDVDEARRDQLAFGVDLFGALGRDATDLDNAAAADCDIGLVELTAEAVGDRAATDDEIDIACHHAFSLFCLFCSSRCYRRGFTKVESRCSGDMNFRPNICSSKCSRRERRQVPTASVTHFLMKLVLAAPFSFWSLALPSHVLAASLWHFFMKLVIAAPASFLSDAMLLQVSSAKADVAKQAITSAKKVVFMSDFPWLSRPGYPARRT